MHMCILYRSMAPFGHLLTFTIYLKIFPHTLYYIQKTKKTKTVVLLQLIIIVLFLIKVVVIYHWEGFIYNYVRHKKNYDLLIIKRGLYIVRVRLYMVGSFKGGHHYYYNDQRPPWCYVVMNAPLLVVYGIPYLAL